jgi:hypothetical protein
MEKKWGGDREAAGDDFIPYMTTFLLFFAIGDEIGELLKLLLGGRQN